MNPNLRTLNVVYAKFVSNRHYPFTNSVAGFATDPREGYTLVPLPQPFTYNPAEDEITIDGVLCSQLYLFDKDDSVTIPPTFHVTRIGVASGFLLDPQENLPYLLDAVKACTQHCYRDVMDAIRDMNVTFVLRSEVKIDEENRRTPQVYRVGKWTDVARYRDQVEMMFLHGRQAHEITRFKLSTLNLIILDVLARHQLTPIAEIGRDDQERLEPALHALLWQFCHIDADSTPGTRWPQVRFYNREPL